MIINHNMNAMNAHRQMTGNVANAGKSMEKLSSGLRINRAGDDAAGLAISEKMRGQIRGLDQASRNSQDGISMIQTAEGALNETHSILQRMRELGVQAGNDTNTTQDRGEIQKEMNQLTSEVNRIGNTTEFNTQKLLRGDESVAITNTTLGVKGDGATAAPAKTAAAVAGLSIDATVANGSKGNIGFEVVKDTGTTTKTSAKFDGGKLSIVIGTDTGEDAGAKVQAAIQNIGNQGGIDFSKFTVTGTSTATTTATAGALAGGLTKTVASVDVIGGTLKAGDITLDGKKLTITGDTQDDLYKDLSKQIKADTTLNAKYSVGAYTAKDNKLTLTQNAGFEGPKGADVQVVKTFAMQVGANEKQTMTLDFTDMRAKSLGITGAGDGYSADANVTNGTDNKNVESALDVSNSANAGNAVTKIQSAIDKVSAERSKLGAFQNRLEHTINNLGTSSENLTAAESRVRDVDMAKEMMNFSKNNILSQASQAMLAQAKSQPEAVLQLLR